MTEARELFERAGHKTIHDDSYASACVKKWGPLLEGSDGVRNAYVKRCTAILLENEMEHVKSLNEDTLSTNAGAFTKYVFPVLRRVFPNLIANQIVSVQPTTSPVAGVFYYEKKYDDEKGTKNPQYGIGNTPTDMDYDGKLAAGDNIMQNFARYYSSEFNDYDVVCTDTGASTGTLNQAGANCDTTSWSPIRGNAVDGQRQYYVKAYYRILDADDKNNPLEVIATMNDAGFLIDNANSNNVGTFSISNGNWSITPKGTAGTASDFADNTVIYFQYFVNWELVGYTAGASVPSISLDIALHTLKVESRKLKAKWTVEAVDDLRALHGMDAETELVSTFSNEVMLEVDREIIDALVNGAKHQASYTYASTFPGDLENIRSMLTKIGAVAARIHTSTGRAPANFLVASPAVVSLLDQLSSHGDYVSIEQEVQPSTYGPITADYGIARVGTLMKKYAVYQDPYILENKVLVGLKGKNFLDAGFVYAPYVPLQVTPTFMDPNDFTFRKGVRTRYATKMLRPEYYGVVTVSGLPNVISG